MEERCALSCLHVLAARRNKACERKKALSSHSSMLMPYEAVCFQKVRLFCGGNPCLEFLIQSGVHAVVAGVSWVWFALFACYLLHLVLQAFPPS